MRLIIDVNTRETTVQEVRKYVLDKANAAIDKLVLTCARKECGNTFLPERRKRRKYCREECRWIVSNQKKMEKYNKAKRKKQALEAKREAAMALKETR
jgi:hypoxanthine phosphoribosyltransferase